MKIHSDFRDYYDIGLSVGVDPHLHYERKERVFNPNRLRHWKKIGIYSRVKTDRDVDLSHLNIAAYEFLAVGFCGRVYPCLALHWLESELEFVYDIDRATELFPKQETRGGRRWRRRQWEQRPVTFMRRGFESDALFLEIGAPIFVARWELRKRNPELVANAMLRHLQFAKIKDPFTAFQDVATYLGNQLVRRDSPDTIADEYRIAMHGFDKNSFRHPTRLRDLESNDEKI
jgi:hypothetical protein